MFFFLPSTQEQQKESAFFCHCRRILFSKKIRDGDRRGLVWQLYPLELGRERAAGHLPKPGPINLEPGTLSVTGSALRCSGTLSCLAGINQHLQREKTRLGNPALLGTAQQQGSCLLQARITLWELPLGIPAEQQQSLPWIN